MYMGATLRVFLEDEKAALVQQIDAEIEKVKGEKPPPPTRGLSPAEQAEAEEEEEDNDGGGEGGGMNIADLVPRNDIRFDTYSSVVAFFFFKEDFHSNSATCKIEVKYFQHRYTYANGINIFGYC